MRNSVVAALLCVALALPVAGQRPDSSSIRLAVPTSIGDFAFVGRHDYDDPALGVMLRYRRSDSLQADVFAYPGPDFGTNCPLACAQKAFDEEVNGFIAAFPELVKAGYVDSIAIDADRTLTPSPNDPWKFGRHLAMHVVRKGHRERSDYFLYYLPSVQVKVRATYEPDTASVGAILIFAAAAPHALLGPPQAAASDSGARSDDSTAMRAIHVSATLPGSLEALFQRAIRALVDQGYTVADSSTAAGRIVSAPLFTWPKELASAAWHGTDSPGVIVYVRVTVKGDSTTIDVASRSPVVAGWKDAKVASQLQMMTVLTMAHAIAGAKPKAP